MSELDMPHLFRWSLALIVVGCVPQPATAASEVAGCAPAHRAAETPAPAGTARRYVKPPDAELRKRLTSIQYWVTERGWTEPPYRNEYWDNEEQGLYVDIVTGEPLFLSIDKYDSHTGWPSFTHPISNDLVCKKPDHKLPQPRTEIRSIAGDSHLGHVFEDGPKPLGLRYCMNSAALRFISVDDLEAQGYGAYKPLFAAAAP